MTIASVPVTSADHAEKDLDALRATVQLIEADDRNASAVIDKIIIFGGPAAILASLTFMKDMAPTPVAGSIKYLELGWLAFLVGSAAGMAALVTTRRAALHLRRLYQKKIELRDPHTVPADFSHVRSWNTATKVLTFSGMATFIGGVVSIALFALGNMPDERRPTAGINADSSALADALVRECQRLKCSITFGYTYDVPPAQRSRDTTSQRKNK